MASIFPAGGLDNFANPTYTKLNGIDVVQAAHVNDLQDAVRAIEELLIAGKTIDYNSNNFIADNTSFKLCIETLDDNLGAVTDELEQHKNAALVSDPAEHHANAVAIDPIGNLTSDRVQPAIYELQSDIDNILGVGSMSPASSLDSRFVNTSGPDTMQGPLTITEHLIVAKNTTLGSVLTDVHSWIGSFNIEGEVQIDGDVQIDEVLIAGSKIARSAAPSASYLDFLSDRLEFYSHGDFVFRLDSDDPTDASADAAVFQVRDGLDQVVFELSESGVLEVSDTIQSEQVIVTNNVSIVGTTIEEATYALDSDTFHLQLDKSNTEAVARFLITMDGDTGSNMASPDLLLNLDESATLTTGVHVLKSGVQEVGYFGHKAYSPNAGGVFFGTGVNFKHKLTNSPSSVVLNIDENVNAQNISITDVSEYGFFVEFDSVAVGEVKVRGTYETAGN